MEKFTQKQLRALVSCGAAKDVTYSHNREDIPENYIQIGYAHSVYGCSGMLLMGVKSGKLYAVTSRTTAIYIF